MQIRTTVIEGSLAFQMRRAIAARTNECGLQILSLPQLAARLAGGFTTPVAKGNLDLAIQRALAEGMFTELEAVRNLPGMTRAVSRTLRKVWDADVDLRAMGAAGNVRVRELALIEERVRMHLPKTMLVPRDLRNAALSRVHHAARVIGPLTIDQLSYISPIWRPLIEALRKEVSVEWRAPGRVETEWFSGPVAEIDGTGYPSTPTAISCADPRHEVVESLRWARSLITSGSAKPHEIAIVAASPAPWDDHFHALSTDAGIRLHFVHGIPALATRDGQRCAALADILAHGLSQQRVRRLASLCRGQGVPIDELPDRWLTALPRGAALGSLEAWRRAISAAAQKDTSLAGALDALPLLEVLAKGIVASREAARLFLRGRSAQAWEAALQTAPPEAIELSLGNTRFASEGDAADSIV